MIKFIYFDVGGVALLDFSGTNNWDNLKKEMGVDDKNNELWEKIWDHYKNEICISRDVDSLIPIFNKETGLNLPADYSMFEGFISRFDLNPSIWPVIRAAKNKYQIGLLTNMYPRMLQGIFDRKLIPPKQEWDVVIDSSIVKYQKPEKEIYEIAEKESGVNKDEILFIENTLIHIQAAKKFGWQVFHYDSTSPEESSKNLAEIIGNTSYAA